MKNRKHWPTYLIALALILILAASIPFIDAVRPEVEVDFESIEIADSPHSGGGLQLAQPDLAVVSEKEDTYTLQSTISSASISKLVDLDYKAYFALVVYQGREPTDGYNVEIQRITHQGNTIHVFVHFTERDPAKPAHDIITSPYHLVKIQREGIQGEMVFIVYSDGKEILRRTDTVM